MLKKGITFFLVFILSFGVLSVSALDNSEYVPYRVKLWVDNQLVETDREYLTQNGNMLVPAQTVLEMMGASIHWEPEEWKIRIQKENRTLTMYIANNQCANGAKVEKMSAQPTLLQGTVMIPLRYVAEALGAVVRWEGNAGSVIVSTTGKIQLPTAETLLKTKTVVLDPGHGGSDPGAVAGEIKEKDLNLKVAKILKEMLDETGMRVYMTRTEDKYVDLYSRAAKANQLKADLFVSIHHNACPDPKVQGVMTLYYPSNKKQKMNGLKFASIVQKNMVEILKTKDLGIIARPKLVVIRETSMPAVIAELGYMTNKSELKQIVTYPYQQQAALSLFHSILEALQQ